MTGNRSLPEETSPLNGPLQKAQPGAFVAICPAPGHSAVATLTAVT